jgi:hypothetical protein
MKGLVIITLVLIIILIINTRRVDGFVNWNIQVVVAAYNEDVNWIAEEPFSGLDILCYHKGSKEIPNCNAPNCRIEKLPNVGRCDHTYLHHIVENYNNLAPVTVFIPGSWTDPEKKDITLKVVHTASSTGNTVIPAHRTPEDIYGFQIDEWTSTNNGNKSNNVGSKLLPCPQRPFGVWYKLNFPEISPPWVHYKGVFAVSREDITKNPVEHYERLLKYLNTDSNPEAGHYIERAWVSIFWPVSDECLIKI